MRATPTTTPRYVLMEEQSLRRFELHTLEVWQTPSVGKVCKFSEVSSFSQFISCLEICVCPHILLYKKMKKNEGNYHGDNIESSSTRHHGKCSQCPAFDIKQCPAGRSPEDHQVRAHAYLYLNKAQSCFMLSLSILVCSGLNVCCSMHS